jgi:hypothetical protein
MKNYTENQLRKSIKRWIIFFIIFLVLSGITAFPVETELQWLMNHSSFLPTFMREWLSKIHTSVHQTNLNYPQLAYGTDWLAFAHIVIAVVFIGPLIDPVKNVSVLIFGMIACAMIFPLAFICGPIRSIPFFWRLIDCSFGVFGFIPLWVCYVKVRQIEKIIKP